MQTQLAAFTRWLSTFIYALLSNPQRIRLVIVVIALCLILAALFVPTVVTFAGNMGGGGS